MTEDAVSEETMRGPLRSRTRGFGPIQAGGRFLLVDTIEFGEESLKVLLTLKNGTESETYAVTGELYGNRLPPVLNARLYAGMDVYFAEVLEGHVTFDNVHFDDEIEHINLTLETPEDVKTD